MSLSSYSKTRFRETIIEIKEKLGQENEAVITDIHLQPVMETGSLLILDDDQQELSNIPIKEWEEYNEDNFYLLVENELREELIKIQEESLLDDFNIWKPFSFLMIDQENEVIVDLLLVDGDTVILSESLLKGLDEEMDEFMKQLLKE